MSDDVTRLPRGTAYWADVCRNKLAAAKENTCPCGVPRTHCADHREEATA